MTKDTKTYEFIIEKFTPETMEFSRLLEYYQNLNKMISGIVGVHLVNIEKSSHMTVLKIDSASEDKFYERIDQVRDGTASRPILIAKNNINKLLLEDNTKARVRSEHGENVIQFEVVGMEVAKRTTVKDFGNFVGKLYHISGKNSHNISIRIDTEQFGSVPCKVDEAMARKIRVYALDFLRIHGQGVWTKVGDGPWSISDFKIDRFEVVQKTSLKTAVDNIRKLSVSWEDNPLKFIADINKDDGMAQ